ncbi:MAG: histidine ammonia-lyase [Acidobacteria bacterium]|jgi:histidine ammonia-lyase|nr:MAG: histidine ammonia-lyase [Acidobacteriota bacterium]GIU82168.1 MAG: histidine ammonia-lyase [Pyrinomonadaceae bacterium]
MKEIILDGESLTFEDVIAVAYGKPGFPKVSLSEKAIERVEQSAEAVQKLLQRGEVAYGITTGFGALKDKIIPPEMTELLQRNIVLSHSVGVGKPFDTATTRAIMLIRANTLARGFSGVRSELLKLILEFLNRGIHPVIPEKGSLGASGDLAPLAHFACALIGEGEVEFEGVKMPAIEALKKAGLEPIKLKAKEGLALTNGTSVMTAVGLLETQKAKRLADLADIAGCMSLEALNGTILAFDERIHNLRPHPRQVECAANLRRILEGSEFVRGFDPSNVQDAYTLRCMPQVHGACRDAIAYAEWLLNIELNSVTDNPLIFVDGGEIEVISGGNFHGEPLALAFDYLAIALSELCNISERRIMRLTDEASNAHVLPAFLTEKGGINSGFMIVQYTAAALCSENKVLAHPASVDTIPTSANVEDHVSMGLTSALKLRQITENLEHVLSLELFAAAQGIDFRKKIIGNKNLGKGTREFYEKIRSSVPFIEEDEYMKPMIDKVFEIVHEFVMK